MSKSSIQNTLAWIGVIPAGWQVVKLRQILSPFSERNHSDMPLLSVVREKGVIVRNVADTEENHNYVPEDLSGYKLVKKGQFAMNKMKAWQGSYGVSKFDGIVSPAYFVFNINLSINKDFFDWAIRSKTYVSFFRRASDGIRVGQWDLSMQRMKEIPFLVPPRDEQDQIVRFLDWKVSEINKLISISRKKAVEYRELRKAVIDQGVLHGFTNTGVIHSEIHWLGDIPQGWKVMPLKRICKVNASIVEQIRKADDNDMVTFLPMENVSETGLPDCSIKRTVAEVKTGFSSFAKGDVVVAKITPCFENGKGACLDSLDTEIGFGTTEFINLRPSKNVLSKYLYMITVTRPFRKFGESVMTGSAGQKRVPASFIKNFSLGIPPVYEQEIILRKIEQQLTQIDKCIDIEQRKVEALHELKTKLISDVATGKIDVRDVVIPDYEYVDEKVDTEDENDSDGTEKQENAE